ncbi:flagellar basal body P-ring formation chaperone FlgA [Desulfosoma caldarium]|uniref:Flagella basal body P-ring formation protein FlgA n=1 Tax=Desulfosoma caldarium TaxID=610254 RepID=A0A3N1VGC8_9BACT|nr:flagellar basal body P-ring formation chaperone FlgA [Desulfosoma caldarium]ROR01896.1 flagella basal body P-ring formation protein FlgA [Desulfosoma caldarium]
MKGFVLALVLFGSLFGGFTAESMAEQAASSMSSTPEPSVIQVRSIVETSEETLTLYDLLDNAHALPPLWIQKFQSISLGPSPSLGSEKAVRTDHLAPYLKKVLTSLGVQTDTVYFSIPERIVLRRKAAVLEAEFIENLYRAYIDDHAPWNASEMEIRDIVISGLASIPDGHVTHEIEAPQNTSFVGVVPVTMHFFVDGQKVRSLRVAGKVLVRRTVLHASQNLRRHTILEPEHVELREITVSEPGKIYATRLEDVVGKRVVRPVRAGQPLEMAFLAKPLCVTSGKPVTILYQEGPLKLSARGESKDNGAQGDWIRVVNLASKKILKVQVLDEDTVLLKP